METAFVGKVESFCAWKCGPPDACGSIAGLPERYPQVNMAIDQGPAEMALQELSNNNFDFAICGYKIILSKNGLKLHRYFH